MPPTGANLKIANPEDYGDVLAQLKLKVHAGWSSNKQKYIARVTPHDSNRVVAQAEHDVKIDAMHLAINGAAAMLDYQPEVTDPVEKMQLQLDELARKVQEQSNRIIEQDETIRHLTGGRSVSIEEQQAAPVVDTDEALQFETDEDPDHPDDGVEITHTAAPEDYVGDEDDDDTPPVLPEGFDPSNIDSDEHAQSASSVLADLDE